MPRVLIVEDNRVEAREISFFLTRAGFDVETEEDAERGFQRVTATPFDLLLCDLHLPGENGFALCRRIRAHATLAELPIVLLTRFSDPLNVLRGLEVGADGFISKGQNPQNIVERLYRVLLRRASGTPHVGPDRVVFLETEFEVNADRNQLVEVLLSGFEDVVLLNEKYEEEVQARARAQKSLRDANVLYHSLVETLPLAVARKDREGRYTFANHAFCKALDKPLCEVAGQTDFALYPRALAERYAEEHGRILDTGDVLDAIETRHNAAGAPCYYRVRKLPVVDSKKAVIGTQEIHCDITDLKRTEDELRSLNASLEQRVAERTSQLEAYTRRLEEKNVELDKFVYVASHDLQEPVRKLISFSQLLEKDVEGELNDRARADLGFITDAAHRMQALVQDLLMLSRAGQSALKREIVSLDDCVDAALDSLSVRIESTGARIVRTPLPEVCGDRTTLTQLYQNLIGNALKFTRAGHPAVVEITAEGDGSPWVLGVRDNGIGIESQYAQQIFGPFQRLHARDEYEGTGIGLAICQTTVERHGGQLWVESAPGIGSHFKFTLSATAPPSTEPRELAHATF